MERTDPERALLPEKWAQASAGDEAAVAWLVRKYHWLSLKLAHQKRVPPTVEREDVISWANWGLFDAVRKFKPQENTDGKLHEHFIGFGTMRINGAILDGLKAPGQTWATREVWRLTRKMKEAEEELEQSNGQPPTRAQIAAHMGVEEKSLPLLQLQIPLTSVGSVGDGEEIDYEFFHDPDLTDHQYETDDMVGRLIHKLSGLPQPAQEALVTLLTAGSDTSTARQLGVRIGEWRARRRAALLELRDVLQA